MTSQQASASAAGFHTRRRRKPITTTFEMSNKIEKNARANTLEQLIGDQTMQSRPNLKVWVESAATLARHWPPQSRQHTRARNVQIYLALNNVSIRPRQLTLHAVQSRGSLTVVGELGRA